ncbi:HNH endonuclease signature motif containing protein [Aspergillus neoniger CBS 115656]|uniref:HNH nuclease domain-containing protein n=1 Tax=Aspergillus neoniger (strain CBS 115656) TaxID=1448310 RepID=A0A318Y1U0_ASPNB|nr:hypothetical protein BO87DRAFT_463875 [Aspergillus neoniger CBS 115656]PYH28336.1 hypothetical protein BO87DRAFT_463875 [Aspergillus neoniger CBS 115656]
MGAYDEVEDPRRLKLIAQISDSIDFASEPVNPGFWAFLWLSELSQLEGYTQVFFANPRPMRSDSATSTSWTRCLKVWNTHSPIRTDHKKRKSDSLDIPETMASKIPRVSTNVAQTQKRSDVPKPTSPAKAQAATSASKFQDYSRSVSAADECKKRDKLSCLVTRGGDCIETAHIYPFSLGRKAGFVAYDEFWERLGMFWPPEKIKAWEAVTLGPDRTEILENLISLASTVHGMWGTGKLAFKPLELSEDKRMLTVEFHWLRDWSYGTQKLRIPPSNPVKSDSSSNNTRLINCETLELIRSGDILTWTTDDPEKRPLPSIELLEMQWVLNRLVALAGAADVSEEDLDREDMAGLETPVLTETEEEELEENDPYCEAEGSHIEESALSVGPISPAGENRPLLHQQRKKHRETTEGEDPLELRSRDLNVR